MYFCNRQQKKTLLIWKEQLEQELFSLKKKKVKGKIRLWFHQRKIKKLEERIRGIKKELKTIRKNVIKNHPYFGL